MEALDGPNANKRDSTPVWGLCVMHGTPDKVMKSAWFLAFRNCPDFHSRIKAKHFHLICLPDGRKPHPTIAKLTKRFLFLKTEIVKIIDETYAQKVSLPADNRRSLNAAGCRGRAPLL